MAINKDSKAYKGLQEKGYSDEQITQMYGEMASGKENVASNTKPANEPITVWPMNANLNYYQYWDDSNPAQQGQRWGMNEKYTGEGVSNTYIDYNKDLKTADLDPYYLYWDAARQQNRKEAGYIARRNDNIASALYNEWRVSKEEVANFLGQQKEWMNSTEADRLNTIESVWKRLGEIKPEEKPDPSKADQIVQDTSGKLYWKVTAEEWNPKQWIDTLADANNVFTAMQETRAENLKAFINYNPADIAELDLAWTSPFSEQTIRDARQYYPEFMSQVDAEKKKKLWQQNVTAIASGGEMVTDTNWQSNINNEIANFWASNANGTKSSVEISHDVRNAIAWNQTASEASETMAGIEEDMAILKNRLKNLRTEANAAFKWDVPDYLVNAYINNKTQEIQNQMSILEDRYNAAYQRYTTELSNTQWEKEYELKEKQLQLQEKEFNLKKWQAEQWIPTTSSSTSSSTSAKNSWDSFEVTTLSDADVAKAVDQLRDMYDNGQLWNAQCAAWIQKYYLPMLWINLPNLSSIDRKKALINEDKDYTPKRGDLIILNSKSSPSNWHIGIVLNVREDGYIEYMDWNGSLDANWNWTEKVAINGINPESAKILWFRNVNKWQGQNSSSSSGYQWEDSDYSNFQTYLDPKTNQTTAKAIAMKYGFWEDYLWMTNFAREQLKNRNANVDSSVTVDSETSEPTINEQWRVVVKDKDWNDVIYAYGVTADDPRLNESWFDPVLGYNVNRIPLYNRINSDTSVGNTAFKNATDKQKQEAEAYKEAQRKWEDVYSDSNRKVTREYGFAVGKSDVYNRLDAALNKWTLTPNQWNDFLNQLWFTPTDAVSRARAISEATDELANFKKYSNDAMKEYYKIIDALEYIIMQDANYAQRQYMMRKTKENWDIDEAALWWEAADWANKYNLLRASEVFEQLASAKQGWVSLYPVSDADMKMVKAASTTINWTLSQANFRKQIDNKYKTIRELVGKPITDEQLAQMWNQEKWGSTLAWAITNKLLWGSDFSNYLIYDSARYSWLLWWINYWKKKTEEEEKAYEYKWIWDIDWNTTNNSEWGSFTSNIASRING